MKKLLVLSTLLAAPAFATPYIGAEYGVAATNHNFEPVVNFVQLTPDNNEGVAGVFMGYQFSDNLALELGYRQSELSDGQGQESLVGTGADLTEIEKDWDADIKVKQLTLMPIYSFHINDKWTAKLGAGISYSRYDFSASFTETSEHVATDIETVTSHITGDTGTHSEIGAIASVGVEYAIMPEWTVGVNAKYQADSFANSSSVSLMTRYSF
ncbi:porin family protein [Shewanella sp. SNU WT4]|uniref:AcfA family outer membrane beta-barrel protein n=1 Tax=Shewanella sp. SNU WT4 TaxID=2590015 RepID=UPI00112DF464|nr:AcfA family outer membrane beta-barrel protein [Shewanella sp. SNU WT4]QDF66200.1 porin family protein [Shewanella sp. SNU WT4]